MSPPPRAPHSTAEDDSDLAPAALAPQYAVECVLGRGGMATVYLARESKHGRKVAVKVLNRGDIDEGGTNRFLFEIHLTAQLSHPHIVPLLDSGRAGGKPFYVMPFVEGGTLRSQTDHGPMATADALKLAGEVADALAYAHAQGVLHRDVKPENIMLSGRSAVVTDFGIARALQQVGGVTDPVEDVGLVVGTAAYMSPEQATGEEEVDERSDVYSLGAVLYEMLTGEAPFTGDTIRAVIAMRFMVPPPSPRERRGELLEVVDAIVRRAMALEPADRYASAAELGDAIGRVSRALDAPDGQAIAASKAMATPSVAVLPFENATGNADDDFLASGIADEVMISLARGGHIRVAGRGSSVALGDRSVDVREVSDRLGVRTVLVGAVRRAGDRLRVTAQLLDGTTGLALWADRFDRTMDDVFAVQDEIAERITEALRGTLLVADAPRADSRSATLPESYNAYLRARHLLNRRTARDMTDAQVWFRRAIHVDERFAAAHAGLADAWALLGVYGEVAPAASYDEARRAASAALQRDSSLAAAHAVLAVVQAGYDWDFAAAAKSFETSLALTPEPTAYQWLATMVLLPMGRTADAFVAIGRAMRLDPLSLSARSTLTVALLYARRLDEAVHAARETLAIEPRFAVAHYFHAQALAALGDVAAALEAVEQARELSGGSGETTAFAAWVHGLNGDRTRAAALLDDLHQRVGQRYVSESHLAIASLGTGDRDGALALLERAVDARATDLIWLGVRPAWDSLRDEPRFRQVMARVGLR